MKLFVVADDLTGSNATGVLLSKDGFKCATFMYPELITEKEINSYDVVSISTDSRGIKKEDAYNAVYKEVREMKDKTKLFTKRIDSTLRGNVGAEIDGIIDALDGERVAVVVASYPDSERISVGGFLLVNSIPLEKTPVSKDPKAPVTMSRVKNIIKQQSKYEVGELFLSDVMNGEEYLKEKMEELKNKGNKIIVVDAATDDEIITIAKASKNCSFDIICVDPGPFTRYMMSETYGPSPVELGKKVFFAIGSVSEITRKQIETLLSEKSPKIVHLNSENLIYEDKREKEIKNAISKIKDYLKDDRCEALGVITTLEEDEVLDLGKIAKELNTNEEELSQRINKGIAEITEIALEISSSAIGGLYTSGGDVTVEVMNKLGVNGIELKDEVIPLAVYGKFIGGKYPGMPVVTKGGLIGDSNTLVKCIDYLSTKVSTLYYAK
jgi:D-threonate/D-erythronate kinase